jgi:hypothetical protein
MNLYCIIEEVLNQQYNFETDIIGIADTVEQAIELIGEYYGPYEVVESYEGNIEMGNIVYRKKISPTQFVDDYCFVTIMKFPLNKLQQ